MDRRSFIRSAILAASACAIPAPLIAMTSMPSLQHTAISQVVINADTARRAGITLEQCGQALSALGSSTGSAVEALDRLRAQLRELNDPGPLARTALARAGVGGV